MGSAFEKKGLCEGRKMSQTKEQKGSEHRCKQYRNKTTTKKEANEEMENKKESRNRIERDNDQRKGKKTN